MSHIIVDDDMIDQNYSCAICKNIYDNPHRPETCEHIFCKTCLHNSSVVSQNCPLCRKPFDIKKIKCAQNLNDEIKRLRYLCKKCKKISNIQDIGSHYCSLGSQQASAFASNIYVFKCPFCDLDRLDLDSFRDHCNQAHSNERTQVVCPICASMPWGDPNLKSQNFIQHLNLRHKFEYDRFVDLNVDENEMLKMALIDSLQDH